MGPAHWQPSHRGGSHVYRDLHNYVADSHTLSTSQDHEPTCSKAQRTTRLRLPGLMIIWCACCGKAVLFSLMTDSESPRTIFELLYTHCPEAPARFQFDNGCNVHRYALHREPSFFKFTQFLVDQLHFAGHKNCSLAYSTGEARGQCTARQFVLHVTVQDRCNRLTGMGWVDAPVLCHRQTSANNSGACKIFVREL